MSSKAGKKRTTQAERDRKLRELILFIAIHSEGDEPFGAVKLNKLLFYCDFLAYVHFGEPITGQEYQALPQGPAPRRMLPVVNKMIEKDELAIRKHDYYGKDQQRAFAQRSPDIGYFSFEELELVDRVIKLFWGQSATAISNASHRFPGWKLAKKGETIPYAVALIGSREPTLAERKRGLELEAMARECLAETEAA